MSKQKCLIVGGLGWLGSEYTRRCLMADYHVILADFYEPDEALKNEFDQLGKGKWEYHHIDAYNHDDFQKLLTDIVNNHGEIHGLVNNAYDFSGKTGFTAERNDFIKGSVDDWVNTFDCGIVWPMLATQAFLKQKNLNDTRIINISSMYALVAPSPEVYQGTAAYMLPQYGIAKAALVNFSKYIASYYGEKGVRCNAIVPGAFPRPENISPEFTKNLTSKIPLQMLGRPEDVAGIVTFLLDKDSQYITGQTIVSDGGWTIR